MSNMKKLIVETQNGLLKGITMRSIMGYDYCAFKGIPYAKPPVGDLRFKDPVPPEDWSDIRDATNYSNMCLQYDLLLRDFAGDEDCLYLNVFVKSIDKANLKPVLFWIHGGAYMFNNGNDNHHGPDYLIRHNIVVVTFNYRLGIFGFLNLDHEIATGNQGLKDQIMALRWVKANIANFGGDPNNITLAGESSGATSAHVLALSPLCKGLFHKVICQSGCIFNNWARVADPKRYLYHICSVLGLYSRDPEEIYHFLKSISSKRLIQAQENFKTKNYNKNYQCRLIFGPNTDDKSPNPVMPIPLIEAASNGIQVPLLIGYNNCEGFVCLTEINKKVFSYMNNNFEEVLGKEITEDLKQYGMTSADLRYMYFKDKQITHNDYKQYAFMSGDINFIKGIHQALKVQVKNSKADTYFYEYSFNEPLTSMKIISQYQIPGATHFDEVESLFHLGIREKIGLSKAIERGTPAYKMMEQMTTLWTNFVKHGTPTPTVTELIPEKWIPVTDDKNIECYLIDKEIKMGTVQNIEEKFLSFKTKKI